MVIHTDMCMSVYMYVCIYMCMYVYMYVYVRIYVCVCMYVCMYVYGGRDSSVGIASSQRAGPSRDLNPGGGRDFPCRPD